MPRRSSRQRTRRPVSSSVGGKLRECFETLAIDVDDLISRSKISREEYVVVKQAFHAQALAHHPDKGGEASKFREVHEAYTLLKETFERDAESRLTARVGPRAARAMKKRKTKTAKKNRDDDGDGFGYAYASYEFYEEMAKFEATSYRVEYAKSGRSKCVAKRRGGVACEHGDDEELIRKGEVRCGARDQESGPFGRRSHLRCWRVPRKVWKGFPDAEKGPMEKKRKRKKKATKKGKKRGEDEDDDKEEDDALKLVSSRRTMDPKLYEAYTRAISMMNEDLLEGFNELDEEDKESFVLHCANRQNWAKPNKKTEMGIMAKAHQSTPFTVAGAAEAIARRDAARNRTAGGNKENAPKNEQSAEKNQQEADEKNWDVLTKHVVEKRNKKRKTITTAAPARATQPQAKGHEIFVLDDDDDDGDGKLTKPGDNDVVAGANALAGKKFVLTGVFPEIGGGAGLYLGKERTKTLLKSFGASVVGSISGKTTHLVVGTNPGVRKVEGARNHRMKRTTIEEIQACLKSGEINNIGREPMIIESFSGGFWGNGLAYHTSSHQLADLAGLNLPQQSQHHCQQHALPSVPRRS